MVILELAVQAVRGFAQSGRIALKPGYLVLRPQVPGPAPLCGLVTSLCFSDGRGGDAVYLAPGQKAGKAGLTLLGNDQTTYRLVRDLGGAGALHRLNKTSGQFEVVTQDATEAAQFLRSQVGVPPKTTFEQLFCFTQAQLPTHRPKPKQAAAAGPAKPGLQKGGLASAQPVAAASDVGAAEARLAELERELGLTKEVDQLQFRQDGLGSQMFELEAKLKGGDGLKAAVAEAEAAFAKAPTPESLGVEKDILSRAERYPELLQRRDEALAKLEGERQQAESAVQATPAAVDPVWKDMRFVAGLCAGVGFLVLGAFLEGYPRYVALLEIPSFGFAALLALKYVEDLQGGSRVSRKGDFLATREKKIREDFDAEALSVRKAMATAGVEAAGDLIDLLSRKPLLAEKVAELKDQLVQFEQDPEYASASARFQQLKAEQEAINKTLLEKGGYLRDLREVEREIERTREAIQKAKSPAPAPSAEPSFQAVPTGPTEVFEDPTPQVMLLAADLFTCDVPTAGGMLRDRAAQYLAALSDRRYHAVEFDKNGKGFALAPGRRVPAGELPGRDLDLFYFSVRLTFIEKYCARFKVPVLIEELPTLVDPVKLQLLARMLKHVGTMTQVLQVSADPSLPPMADLAVSI